MGAIRKRVQTADENITIIHTSLVYHLVSCEATAEFVGNIIKTFLTLLLPAKIRDFHNIAPEKKSSHLNLEK